MGKKKIPEQYYSYKKQLIWEFIISTLLIWASLSLGYNSYKEFMGNFASLSLVERNAIKSTFPICILVYLFLNYFLKKNRKIEWTISHYFYPIPYYFLLLNFLFFKKGEKILIPLNFSIIIFLLIIIVFYRMEIFFNKKGDYKKLQKWLPPIIYNVILTNKLTIRAYIRGQSSSFIFNIYTISMIICMVQLIFGHESATKNIINISYFSLVFGLGLELLNKK